MLLGWHLCKTKLSPKVLIRKHFEIKTCEPFSPLQRSKTPETPNLSKICRSDCFWGFQSGGLKFGKICQNLSENYRFSNFDKFFQISVPRTGTPKNNRCDKFWTNLGFRAFLNAVRGKRVRKSRLFVELHSELSWTYPFGPDPLRTPPPRPASDQIWT